MLFNPLPPTMYHIHHGMLVTGHIGRKNALVDIRPVIYTPSLTDVLVTPVGRPGMTPLRIPLIITAIEYGQIDPTSPLIPITLHFGIEALDRILFISKSIKVHCDELIASDLLDRFDTPPRVSEYIEMYKNRIYQETIPNEDLIAWARSLDKQQYHLLRRWCLNGRSKDFIRSLMQARFPQYSASAISVAMMYIQSLFVRPYSDISVITRQFFKDTDTDSYMVKPLKD